MLLQFGAIGTMPSILVGLIALAAVLLVGRVVMSVAWKVVIAATVVVTALWLLGFVGLGAL